MEMGKEIVELQFLKNLYKISHNDFYFFLNVFIYVFLAVLGLRCCMGFSPVVMSGGYSPVAVRGL